MEDQNRSSKNNGPWRFVFYSIEDRIAIGKKYLGRKASDKEAFDFFQYYFCMPECISLDNFATALNNSGGGRAIEGLLIAAGFLTGAYRSLHPHLPYSRYIQRGYFRVGNEAHPRSEYKRLVTYITRKGVTPVLNKFRKLGLEIPDQIEKQIIAKMDLDEWQSQRDYPRFI